MQDNNKSYEINEEERIALQKPLGPIYSKEEVINKINQSTYKIISVGDYTTLFLLKNGINPFIAVIDFKMTRKEITGKDRFLLNEYFHNADTCQNPKGHISKCSIDWAKEHIGKSGKLIIKGEEDLVAVPMIYYAKNALIIYGLRNKGSVIIEKNNDKGNNININKNIKANNYNLEIISEVMKNAIKVCYH